MARVRERGGCVEGTRRIGLDVLGKSVNRFQSLGIEGSYLNRIDGYPRGSGINGVGHNVVGEKVNGFEHGGIQSEGVHIGGADSRVIRDIVGGEVVERFGGLKGKVRACIQSLGDVVDGFGHLGSGGGGEGGVIESEAICNGFGFHLLGLLEDDVGYLFAGQFGIEGISGRGFDGGNIGHGLRGRDGS